jgi:hypothetical protein
MRTADLPGTPTPADPTTTSAGYTPTPAEYAGRDVWLHWPFLVGIVFAVNVSLHLPAGAGMAPVLAASAVVYVGAAAVGSRVAAWPVFLATVVLITLGQLGVLPTGPTEAMVVLGALLAVVGLLRTTTRRVTLVQLLALVGFGAVALLGVRAAPLPGAYLVAAGLLVHAVWDGYHHRTRRVVAPSFAHFCAALDFTLATIIISLATLTAVS